MLSTTLSISSLFNYMSQWHVAKYLSSCLRLGNLLDDSQKKAWVRLSGKYISEKKRSYFSYLKCLISLFGDKYFAVERHKRDILGIERIQFWIKDETVNPLAFSKQPSFANNFHKKNPKGTFSHDLLNLF